MWFVLSGFLCLLTPSNSPSRVRPASPPAGGVSARQSETSELSRASVSPANRTDSLAVPPLTRQAVADWFFIMDHFVDSVIAHPEFQPPTVLQIFEQGMGGRDLLRLRGFYLTDKYDFRDTSVDFTHFTDTVRLGQSPHTGEFYRVDLTQVTLPGYPVESVAHAIATVPMFAAIVRMAHLTPRQFAQLTAEYEQARLADMDYLDYKGGTLRRPLMADSRLGKNVLLLWTQKGHGPLRNVFSTGECMWTEALTSRTKFHICENDLDVMRQDGFIR